MPIVREVKQPSYSLPSGIVLPFAAHSASAVSVYITHLSSNKPEKQQGQGNLVPDT